MRKLARFARDRVWFEEFFRLASSAVLEFADPETLLVSELGAFDVISGGAITNGLLYTLARIPQGCGTARIFDDDATELSNLNRYMLLLVGALRQNKGLHLKQLGLSAISIEAVPARFDSRVGGLNSNVLVGVDHIPSRWEAQRAAPGSWIGVGATSHWSARASYHADGLPCVGCLHPRDDENNDLPIQTVAFVLFMAALYQGSYFLAHIADGTSKFQQTFVTPIRPEHPWQSGVQFRADCPVGHT